MSTLSPARRSLALLPVFLITAFLLAAVWNLTSHVVLPIPVSAQATNLIVNGDFEAEGISPWISVGIVDHGDWNVDHGKVVTISGATSKVYQAITPDSTGVYQFSFECKRVNGNSSTPYLQFSIDTADPNTVSISGECTRSTSWHQSDVKTLILKAGTPYTITIFPLNAAKYHVDNVSLTLLNAVQDIDTGLIENGDFIGSAPWRYDGTASYRQDVGGYNDVTKLGAAQLSPSSAQDQTVSQIVTPTETAIYRLSFECARYGTNTSPTTFRYRISTSQANIATFSNTSTCGHGTGWQTVTLPIILETQVPYTFTFSADATTQNSGFYLDSVVLARIYTAYDFDTGLTMNGELNKANGNWAYASQASYRLDIGAYSVITQLGSIQLPPNSQQDPTVYQTFATNISGTHHLAFNCNRYGTNVSPTEFHYSITPVSGSAPSYTGESTCGSGQGWTEVTRDISLYTLISYKITFWAIQTTQNSGFWLDNVALIPPPPPPAIPGQCPFASDAMHDYPEGVDSLTGNFSNQSTDLSQPIAGGSLQFTRHYASGSISQYASNSQLRHAIPGGWVHNYEMQLLGTAI